VANDWHRGLLLEGRELPENWKDLCDYLDCATVNIGTEMATREAVEQIMDYEKPVLVYTVNDPLLARRLQGYGVDSVFTDVPDVIADNIAQIH
jgi:glycerophosphoryl diester phosphodiesterase